MNVVSYANVEDAPLKNMFEALDSLSLTLQPSFNIEDDFPQVIISDENRVISNSLGRGDNRSFLVTFNISIIGNNIIDVKNLSSELRALIKSQEDFLSKYNLNFFDIQSSPSSLSRGDKYFPVRNFTIKYVVE